MLAVILAAAAMAAAPPSPAAAPAAAAATAAPTRADADRLIAAAKAIQGETRPKEALAAWQAALAAAKAAYPAGSAQEAEALNGVGASQHLSGDRDAAIASGEQALALAEKLVPAQPKLTADVLGNLGVYAASKQDFDTAVGFLDRSLVLRQQNYPATAPELATAYSERAAIDIRLGKLDTGLAGFSKAAAIVDAGAPRGDPIRVGIKVGYGNALTFAGEHRKAEGVLREAVEEARMLPETHPARTMALDALGAEMMVQGRSAEAADIYDQSIALRRSLDGGRPEDLADALGSLAYVRLIQERPEDAEALFLESHALFDKAGVTTSAASVLMAAGTAAARRGDRKLGFERRRKALDIVLAQPNPHPIAVAMFKFKLADSYADVGDYKTAEAMETEAIGHIRKIRPEGHYQRLNSEITLGWIQALDGRGAEGLTHIKPAVDRTVLEARRLELADVKTTGVQENLEPLGRALHAAFLARDDAFGFYMAQVLIESDAGRAAAAENARLAAGSGALSQTLRRRQTLAIERVRLDGEYLRTLSGEAEKAKTIAARIKQIDAEAADAQAVLDRDFPEHGALSRPLPITIAEAQARLEPGEVLIVPVATDEGMLTLALTRTELVFDHAKLTRRETRALVRRIRASLGLVAGVRAAVDASGGGSTVTGFDRQASWGLYQAIFTPKIRAVADRAETYVIAADPVLSTIPLSILVTAPPQGEDDDPAALRATPWLIRKAAIQWAPSIPAMRVAVERKPGGGFFGAGAPTLQGKAPVRDAKAYFRNGSADLVQVKSLPPLPSADGELRAMARALGPANSQVLIGNSATESAVKRADLSKARVVAFATHGLVAGDLDGLSEPALVFTPPDAATPDDDALLTASEAALLTLDADWVVLSACNTAGGAGGDAPGYTGLARAFMYAGGRTILASHWPVRDDASARLTVDTIRTSAKSSPAQALRLATLRLLDDRKVPDGANPAVWAPYTVIGR
jgi:CHAT domain-containing protein